MQMAALSPVLAHPMMDFLLSSQDGPFLINFLLDEPIIENAPPVTLPPRECRSQRWSLPPPQVHMIYMPGLIFSF